MQNTVTILMLDHKKQIMHFRPESYERAGCPDD